MIDEAVTTWNSFASGGGWLAPLTALVAAFVFGQILAWVYEFTFEGLSYSRGFSHTVVLVTISAAILVLAMQHSLLAGLGLFGILSMIRFRTDLRTPRDLVFVMGSAVVGVACGVGAIVIATLGTLIFGGVSLYLFTGPFGSRVRFDGVLRFQVAPAREGAPPIEAVLSRHCRRTNLLSLGETGVGLAKEHVYQVKFYRGADREALMTALRDELNAREARLLLQEASAEY